MKNIFCAGSGLLQLGVVLVFFFCLFVFFVVFYLEKQNLSVYSGIAQLADRAVVSHLLFKMLMMKMTMKTYNDDDDHYLCMCLLFKICSHIFFFLIYFRSQ